MSSDITIGQTVRILPPSPFAGQKGQVTDIINEETVWVALYSGGEQDIVSIPFKLNLLEAVGKEEK